LALPFISLLQVIADASNLVCGLNTEQLTDDKPSLKWVWSCHPFWISVHLRYLLQSFFVWKLSEAVL